MEFFISGKDVIDHPSSEFDITMRFYINDTELGDIIITCAEGQTFVKIILNPESKEICNTDFAPRGVFGI